MHGMRRRQLCWPPPKDRSIHGRAVRGDHAGKAAEVCEAKEVEGLGLPFSTFRALLGRMRAEAYQSGLVWVQGKRRFDPTFNFFCGPAIV